MNKLASFWTSYIWRNFNTMLFLILILFNYTACGQNAITFDREKGGLQLSEGFSYVVVADSIGRARHIAVNENGDIYVALRSTRGSNGGITALRDTNGDGKADVIERFGESGGTGIGIHDGYLYFASDTTVLRYQLSNNEFVPTSAPETIVHGFMRQRQHAVKPFAFDDQGLIYVNVGAPSNACQETMRSPGSPGLDPCPQLERQAGIWRFQADKMNQTQQGDGHHFASGIRNSVALDWNPVSRKLYVVQHGRDQLEGLWEDLYTDTLSAELPSEEFFLVNDGSDFGWPYCYNDHFQGKKVLAPEYGGDGKKVGRCEQFEDPIVAFPGHWAPNDLLFYTGDLFPEKYKKGAFIAFHGSWNRAPLEQAGYNVVFVPFDGELPSGDWEVFADGFAGVDTILGPRDAKYRPMGLAQGPDGSLYISDSVVGRIWRVVYTGD